MNCEVSIYLTFTDTRTPIPHPCGLAAGQWCATCEEATCRLHWVSKHYGHDLRPAKEKP